MTDQTQTPLPPERGHLLRVLGVAFGVAVVIGGTIGQGLLRTPGVVTEGVQTPLLILGLWALGGLIVWIDSLSTVELAASIRQTGGPFTFARRAFGSVAGLAVGIADWLGNLGSIAYVSVVFGEYLHRLGLATSVPIGLLAVALVLVIGAVHWLGTKVGGKSQEIGSAIKAALFVILILALMFAPKGPPVATEVGPAATVALSVSGMIIAMRALFGTYQGWNAAAYFCEEIRDPGRAIARATFSGIAVVTVIYVLVNMALLNVLTPQEMAGSNLVAADAAARVFGPAADPIVTGISLISLVTLTNALVMVYPRVLFAVAREYQVPALSRVSANGTPKAALLLTVVASALLASVGVYETLLGFSVSILALLGVVVNVAAIVLRRREPELERPWKMPLYPLPAIFAAIVNFALFVAFVREDPRTSAEAFALLAVITVATWLATRRTRVA